MVAIDNKEKFLSERKTRRRSFGFFVKVLIINTLVLLLFQIFEVYLLAECQLIMLIELLAEFIWLILILSAILSFFIRVRFEIKNKLTTILISLSPLLILPFFTKEDSARVDFFLRNNERQLVVNKILRKEIKYTLDEQQVARVYLTSYNGSSVYNYLIIENVRGQDCIYFPVYVGFFMIRTEGFVYLPIQDSSIIQDFKLNTKYESSEIFYNPIKIYKLDEHWFYVVNGEFEATFPD